ncbi:MAG: hypothetical protein E7597_04315 [Ruminococcaceae bacterium]|nr:hypothetical protein [Oscillospiraceae bacterium]
MYSRGYDRGIESDGSLRELERSFEENRLQTPPPREEEAVPALAKGKKGLFAHFDMEDLLIIAIAILILMDGDPDNDIILIALALILFF